MGRPSEGLMSGSLFSQPRIVRMRRRSRAADVSLAGSLCAPSAGFRPPTARLRLPQGRGGSDWSKICSCPVEARARDLGVRWSLANDERFAQDVSAKGIGRSLDELRRRVAESEGIGRRRRGDEGHRGRGSHDIQDALRRDADLSSQHTQTTQTVSQVVAGQGPPPQISQPSIAPPAGPGPQSQTQTPFPRRRRRRGTPGTVRGPGPSGLGDGPLSPMPT